MPDKKFDLGSYIEVKDRIAKFYELYGNGRLVTGEVRLSNEPDGVPRVLVQGLAYRSPDDTLPGVGWSWMELPGKTTYTKGSELENTETSAWGRAIGSLGILIDRSIASAQEVANKAQDEAPQRTHTGHRDGNPGAASDRTPPGVVAAEGGLIGMASLGRSGPVDGQLRQTPDGASVGFVIGEGREKVQVVAYGPKAEAFAVVLPVDVLGKRVQVFGPVSTQTMTVRGRKIEFPRVDLERLVTPDARYDFTDEDEPPGQVADKDDLASYGAAAEAALPEPPPDIALVGEQETAPLFDDVA